MKNERLKTNKNGLMCELTMFLLGFGAVFFFKNIGMVYEFVYPMLDQILSK